MFKFFTNEKKEYYKRKLKGVRHMQWDLEFKREKTLMIREEVRREYDGARSKLALVQSKLDSQKKDPKQICEVHNPEAGKEKIHRSKGTCVCEYIENHMDVNEIERFYDEIELLQREAGRYEDQMKQMDLDVWGSKKTNEYPDGVDGIDQQQDSLRELQGMLEDYLAKL